MCQVRLSWSALPQEPRWHCSIAVQSPSVRSLNGLSMDRCRCADQRAQPRRRMMPYIRHFEKSFLAPLYSLIRADFRDKLQQTAAHTAHW